MTDVDINSLPSPKHLGWISACPQSSPAHLKPLNLDSPPRQSSKKTFIFDHRLSMDPCLHPSIFYHHGQLLSHNLGPTPQRTMVPEFSYCSTMLHHDIRIASPLSWVEDIIPRTNDPPWEDKPDERLLWRGSNTGIWHGPKTRWKASHRIHVVELANEVDGMITVLKPPETEDEKVGEGVEMRKARVNPAMMDIAFAGSPSGCAPEICQQLESGFQWRRWQSAREAGNYKYVLDVICFYRIFN